MRLVGLAEIHSFHAHVYFADATEFAAAQALREAVAARFAVQLGRVHQQKIGPHDQPMYQIAFANALFAQLVPWLMLNRAGLNILVHPNTANPRRDHLVHALWLGERLPIVNPTQLPSSADPADEGDIVANTRPSLAP